MAYIALHGFGTANKMLSPRTGTSRIIFAQVLAGFKSAALCFPTYSY